MSSFLRAAFFIGDLIFLNLAIFFSYSLFRFAIPETERLNSIYLFIFSNLAWLFLLLVSNPYRYSRNQGIASTLRGQLNFIFVHVLVVASLIFFFDKHYSPAQIGTMYAVFVPVFFLWKMLALRVIRSFTNQDHRQTNVIIIGERNLVQEVRRYFWMHPELKYRFLGAFEKEGTHFPLQRIEAFVKEKNIQEIYCCSSEMGGKEVKELVDFGINSFIKVKLITDYRLFEEKSLELEFDDDLPVFSVAPVALDDTANQILKRGFDILFSIFVLVFVLSWLFPLIALLIKLDSKGPVFFAQKRSGQGNQDFWCLKFRTMTAGQDSEAQAVQNDPRVTKLGSFLRKTSLDELPQFLNVLEGKMSVVGPRPHPLTLTDKYVEIINRYMARHYVKPGITGLAQASGYRGETAHINEMKNRVKLDRFYIDNWTFFLDVKIIFLTVYSIFSRNEKAY